MGGGNALYNYAGRDLECNELRFTFDVYLPPLWCSTSRNERGWQKRHRQNRTAHFKGC